MADKIEIGKALKPADHEHGHLAPDIEHEKGDLKALTDGQTRRVTKDGVCVCQILCGGTWYYIVKDNGFYMNCSDGAVSVRNCNGRTYVVTC